LETSLISHINSKSKENAVFPTNNQFPGDPKDFHDYASQTQEQPAASGLHEGSNNSSINWRSPAVSGVAPNNRVNHAADLSDDTPPSAEVLLRASEMSIESILKWPIFAEAAPHLVTVFSVPLIEVVGQPKPKNSGQPSSTLPDLSPDTINHLVQNFLNNNHIKNPILDEQELWAEAREFAELGPQWDARSCILVGLLCFRITGF
jgi:hypothetical protein